MLVLSRQRDETIMIGDDVEVTVVDIRGDKVRLGITAPPVLALQLVNMAELAAVPLTRPAVARAFMGSL